MSAARGVLTIAGNDLRRRLRDRTIYIQGFAAPILFAVVVGFAFAGGFNFKATIGVANQDASPLSRNLVDGMMSQSGADSPVRFVTVDPSAVDKQLSSAQIDAAIVLPAGFGDSVMSADPQPMTVVFDANKRITADVAASIAQRIAAQIDTGRLAIGAALKASPGADSAKVQQIVTSGQQVALPITVDITDVSDLYSPVAYFAPSMAILFLFFTIGAGARSLITERRDGTLQRVRAAPVTDATIILGKTSAVLVLGLASLLVIWAVTSIAFGARWGDPVAVVGVIVGIVLATTGISIFLTGVARTDAQAEGLTSMVAFVLALLGGNFLQPGSLPELLSRLSLLTPNGWALQAFTQIGAARAGLVDVLPAIAVMIGIGLVCGIVGLRMVRTKVAS